MKRSSVSKNIVKAGEKYALYEHLFYCKFNTSYSTQEIPREQSNCQFHPANNVVLTEPALGDTAPGTQAVLGETASSR